MNDYDKLQMVKEVDNHYFKNLDFIVSDSEESKVVLIKNFPQFTNKFKVIKTIISPKLIHKLSEEPISKFSDYINLISIGRLTHQKGYDLAIEALKILKDQGYNFTWYIMGDGEDKIELENNINNLGLSNNVVFLGIKENHYPYLNQADIFLHTARFEGFGIVISEAKILGKPMVLTDFNVARSHIKHLETGLITEFTPKDIASKIEMLLVDKKLRDDLSNNISKIAKGTEDEIIKFYNLLN